MTRLVSLLCAVFFRLDCVKIKVTYDQENKLTVIRALSRGTRMIGKNVLDIHTDPDFFIGFDVSERFPGNR